MTTKNTNRQIFPTGEVREFEGEPGEPMLLVLHVRAGGDAATENLLGTPMEAMPAPWEPAAEASGE